MEIRNRSVEHVTQKRAGGFEVLRLRGNVNRDGEIFK